MQSIVACQIAPRLASIFTSASLVAPMSQVYPARAHPIGTPAVGNSIMTKMKAFGGHMTMGNFSLRNIVQPMVGNGTGTKVETGFFMNLLVVGSGEVQTLRVAVLHRTICR